MASECPECRADVLPGAPMCRYCGAALPNLAPPRPPERRCPRGHGDTWSHSIGAVPVRMCSKCGGLWIERTALEELMASRAQQASVLYCSPPQPPGASGRAALCPVCDVLMNQVSFRKNAQLRIDQCPAHGVWFDRDELRRTLLVLQEAAREQPIGRDALDVVGVAVEILGGLRR